MDHPTAGTRPRRRLLIIAIAQLLAALGASASWFWFAAWHHSAIYAMSDELVLNGDISPDSAQWLRAENGSIGAYISQGWGVRALLAGLALAGIAVSSPIVTLAAMRRRID